ncbi:hypothetical protein TTHT_2148 [Thermotomaculum hydrothermale]|uniref:Uncharacterized protein n=1 Tax=Thermotomaculum hydrothermale TaxID=981385 RepID=A0A7R6SZC2_9BACT|nr:hypothetical protein [Thermotomaculum hydrothermale]BBB33580.1 hypothetical protein TTHT_2148 [Thermotomaculum hydrothermale]
MRGEKLDFLDISKLDKNQKRVFFLNVFFPGLGFFYCKEFLLGTIFGILSVLSIGGGILLIFKIPIATLFLWILGVSLHLLGIFYSTKITVKTQSTFIASVYILVSLAFLTYCFIEFFSKLLTVFKINV